jgi:teichuronic acid biosynthesis glycosyltransferase TuaG
MNKVSIIMPAFNNEEYISHSINSVINQSFSNWELIIVDDRSTDNTYDVANKFAKLDNRIKVLQTDINSGSPALPRNIAIEKSTGTFLAFLDSDDVWLVDKLKIQLDFMNRNCIDFSYCAFEVIDINSKLLSFYKPNLDIVSYRDLLVNNVIGCLTVVVRKKLVLKSFKNIGHEDFAFWLDILKVGNKAFLCSNKPLAQYRLVNSSRSSNKFNAFICLFNLYKDVEGYGFANSLILTVKFLINLYYRNLNNSLMHYGKEK